jgi:hypothetical protein
MPGCIPSDMWTKEGREHEDKDAITMLAHFLVGNNRPQPVIINVGHKRPLELSLEIPSSELGPITSNMQWDEIYDP